MLYINGSEEPFDYSLYYKTEKEPYSLELAIRYLKKLGEFIQNNRKVLGAIKLTISLQNSK